MDPPDQADYFRRALDTQGALVGEHEQTLSDVTSRLGELTASVSQLSALLNQLVSGAPATTPGAFGPAYPAGSPAEPQRPEGPPAREPNLPTPERYSGELGACGRFLLQCALVFDQQPATYRTDRSRLAFVLSLLGGRAAQWATALYESNAEACRSFAVFSRELRRVFDHPVCGKEAAGRLLTLSQGNRSVADYAIEFRILAAESGWGDVALQGVFRKGLSDSIKDELAARDETSGLEELILLATRLDNRLRERRREKAVAQRNPRPGPSTMAAAGFPAPSDSSQPPRSSDNSSREEPMQLGRSRLTPEEHHRRLTSGLCLYCGEGGHLVAVCPRRPKDKAHR